MSHEEELSLDFLDPEEEYYFNTGAYDDSKNAHNGTPRGNYSAPVFKVRIKPEANLKQTEENEREKEPSSSVCSYFSSCLFGRTTSHRIVTGK